jgi:hypothetical protein
MSIAMPKYIMNRQCHEEACITEEKMDKVRCEIKPYKIIKMVRIHHKVRRNDIDHLIQVGRHIQSLTMIFLKLSFIDFTPKADVYRRKEPFQSMIQNIVYIFYITDMQ